MRWFAKHSQYNLIQRDFLQWHMPLLVLPGDADDGTMGFSLPPTAGSRIMRLMFCNDWAVCGPPMVTRWTESGAVAAAIVIGVRGKCGNGDSDAVRAMGSLSSSSSPSSISSSSLLLGSVPTAAKEKPAVLAIRGDDMGDVRIDDVAAEDDRSLSV
jgi:hypothetical protein